MCRILHNHGFVPIVNNSRDLLNTVYVGNGEDASRVHVYFPFMAQEKNFRDSKIYKNQLYAIVAELEEVRNAVMCVIKVPYLRTNER